MSLSHRARRQARKRSRVPLSGGGFTSPGRARQYVLDGIARLNDQGELVLVARTFSPFDPLHGRSFHWHTGMSGGCTVMLGRAGKVEAR